MAKQESGLSRRAREALDLIYQRGSMTANELLEALPDVPTNSAARSILRNLEAKGHVRHVMKEMRYVYEPTVPREEAGRSALRKLMQTFFDGSPAKAMQSLLHLSAADLEKVDLEKYEQLIAKMEEQEHDGHT